VTDSSPPTPVGSRTRVAVADDSYLMREALRTVLESGPEVDVVGLCEDGDELIELVRQARPDVVVTDLRMPPSGDDEGLRVSRILREAHPEIGVIVLSQYTDPGYGIELMADGPEGRAYLLKDRVHRRSELLAAVQVVMGGGSLIDPTMIRLLLPMEDDRREHPLTALTPRERDVLGAMASGKSNSAIAEELVLTKRAVEKHVGSIFAKLGLPDEHEVSRRVSAVLLYLGEQGARPLAR
jgi:DNA-binding NarL/FixJ family response regulator